MEDIQEFNKYINQSYIKQKDRIIEEIVTYFNYKYKNTKVTYEDSNFKIEGEDSEQMELCKQDIECMISFVKKD